LTTSVNMRGKREGPNFSGRLICHGLWLIAIKFSMVIRFGGACFGVSDTHTTVVGTQCSQILGNSLLTATSFDPEWPNSAR